MGKREKALVVLAIIISFLFIILVGTAYAYFSLTVTNSFGSKTIASTTPIIGSVNLSTGTSISLDLTADQIASQASDVTYYASTSGATTTVTSPVVATATASGNGVFSCNYTLQVTASATQNMYAAFLAMPGHSTGQIVLTIDGVVYDFNTTGIFPLTHQGTITNIKAGSPQNITAQFKLVNKSNVDQTPLRGTDISLSFSANSFSCTQTDEYTPVTYYYVYDVNGINQISSGTTNNSGLTYYLKGYVTQGVYDEICGVFNGNEYCLDRSVRFSDAATKKAEMEALGATCNSTYSSDRYLVCSLGQVRCYVGRSDVYCGSPSKICSILYNQSQYPETNGANCG